MGVIGGPQDDLTLRASLYGVVFQSFADRGEWESGLRAMDQAISDMPRTNHRLLIFKVQFNLFNSWPFVNEKYRALHQGVQYPDIQILKR